MSEAAIAASAKRKAYINIVLPLFIISIISYLDRVNVGYAALTMNKDLGFTSQVFGMGAGIFFAGYVLLEIPGALIAERYSPRYWLARIMISWGIVCGMMAFMTTTWEFYLYRFLLGAAEASLYPVLYASCIPRWFAPEDRARTIAILLTSLQISSIIGAPLAGSLLEVTAWGFKGWQMLFIIEAIPAVIFGFVIIRWMADWPKDAKWLTQPERDYLQQQYERELAAKTAIRRYSVWEAFRDKEVLKLCLAYFCWITGFWGFNYWMPQVLKSVSGWSNMAIGWLSVIPMLFSLAFMLYIGHSSSQRNEKRWHGAIGMFIGAIGMGVGVLVQDPLISFFFLTLSAIGVFAPFGVWWSYPTTFLSGPAAAGAIGMINSCGNIGGFVGPYITGFVKDATGSFVGSWIYLACSMVVAGILMLTMHKKVPDEAAVETEEVNTARLCNN